MGIGSLVSLAGSAALALGRGFATGAGGESDLASDVSAALVAAFTSGLGSLFASAFAGAGFASGWRAVGAPLPLLGDPLLLKNSTHVVSTLVGSAA